MAKVKIRIKPLHGIGGVGNAGDEAWMEEAEAKQYEADGYVEILPPGLDPSTSPAEAGSAQDDKPIMKPQSKRRSSRKAKK